MTEQNSWIAIVDDDTDMAKALSRLLHTSGFRATSYGSAEEYLNTTLAVPPICFVIDVHLPGLNGFELFGALKRNGNTSPAIFMSAFDDEKYQRQAIKLKAAAYLVKPFAGHELIDLIKKQFVSNVQTDGAPR